MAESRTKTASKGFTAEEKAAMKERARELKKGNSGESDVLAKIAAMQKSDRASAQGDRSVELYAVTRGATHVRTKTRAAQ